MPKISYSTAPTVYQEKSLRIPQKTEIDRHQSNNNFKQKLCLQIYSFWRFIVCIAHDICMEMTLFSQSFGVYQTNSFIYAYEWHRPSYSFLSWFISASVASTSCTFSFIVWVILFLIWKSFVLLNWYHSLYFDFVVSFLDDWEFAMIATSTFFPIFSPFFLFFSSLLFFSSFFSLQLFAFFSAVKRFSGEIIPNIQWSKIGRKFSGKRHQKLFSGKIVESWREKYATHKIAPLW